MYFDIFRETSWCGGEWLEMGVCVVSAYLLRTPMETRWVYPFYELAEIVSKMNHLFELK